MRASSFYEMARATGLCAKQYEQRTSIRINAIVGAADWRKSYLETVTNLREVRANIASLEDPCPKALVNPHPAPPVRAIFGTPYLQESQNDELEDWHENGNK